MPLCVYSSGETVPRLHRSKCKETLATKKTRLLLLENERESGVCDSAIFMFKNWQINNINNGFIIRPVSPFFSLKAKKKERKKEKQCIKN